jgi:riboflavin-specific deaminase-like protein
MPPIEALLAEAEAERTNKDRPLVTLAYAQSLDGSLAALPGVPLQLSGAEATRLTHTFRAAHDAILVGIGTVIADDPQLSVRYASGADPQPVVLDSHLRIPTQAKLLHNPHTSPWIAATQLAGVDARRNLEALGARVIPFPCDQDDRVPLDALLAYLSAHGIRRLMVEGGAGVIGAFIRQGLADLLVATVAPYLVGGLNLMGQAAFPLHNPTRKLEILSSAQYGPDLVVWAKPAGGSSTPDPATRL